MKSTSKIIKRLGLMACLFLLGTTAMMAQTFVLKGNVKDDTGEGAIGATVIVEGTTNGVVTDLDGNFSLQNVKEGDVISISYVGYKTESVTVAGQAREGLQR